MSEQNLIKIQYGDYQTLSKILGISSDAAKMRYRRGDENAVKIMRSIVANREKLIEEHQTK